MFYVLVYYPCMKTECPIIYDEDWSKWGDDCNEDNEKLRRLESLTRQHANILIWHRGGNRCRSWLDADRWMKKCESSIGALLK